MNDIAITRTAATVAPGFEQVGVAFATALEQSPRGGAALSVIVDGTTVVDLWGGSADVRSGRPWVESTTSVMFSMTKGLVALLVARLVEQGLIDLDAPVARYWPEFAQAGKDAITVRQVMAHRAGLSYPVQDLTRDDLLRWDPVVTALAAQAPLWTPGEAHQYHALTYGWLVGEVVRRVTGLSVGAAFARYLTDPVGAEAWIGVPAAELDRVAHLAPGPGFSLTLPDGVPDRERFERAFQLGGAIPAEAAGDGTGLNDPALQQAEIPAGVGIATARAVASLWSSAIVATPGTTPLPAAVLDDMTVTRSSGQPLWRIPGLPEESWGTGFNVPSEPMPLFGPTSFGHGGAGGQLSFADRDSGVAFAFLTNDLQVINDLRVATLIDAVRASLG
ncbi:serine hydrolase domain-containing protein [Pseudonocardia sp. GCM10023141]|uniref:serine hydrolase domain-containing protein n=1 Tax=Pseudonocardia sp. GCM10023141 TaxID=3252653 RepID=UPI00361ED437